MNSALLSSKKMDYCTPQGFFDTLNAEDQEKARQVASKVTARNPDMLLELAGMQALQALIHPARKAWQTGVVGVVLQVRRYQGKHRAIGIALVLLGAAQQVIVDAEIDCRRVIAQGTLCALLCCDCRSDCEAGCHQRQKSCGSFHV